MHVHNYDLIKHTILQGINGLSPAAVAIFWGSLKNVMEA